MVVVLGSIYDSGLYEENEMLKLLCPECGKKKNMRLADCEYRKENDIEARCVHCEFTGEISVWTVKHGH